MTCQAYLTEVSDDAWAFVALYVTPMTAVAPQRDPSLREVFNGLRSIVRVGAAWRLRLHALPLEPTVYHQS